MVFDLPHLHQLVMIRTLSVATLLAAFLLFGPASASAQDVPTTTQLAERLNVSESTASTIYSALANTERQPGYLWSVAASLHSQLTAEERAELTAAARTGSADRQSAVRQRSERHARGQGQARAPRQRSAQPLLRGVDSLTDDQRAQIQAIRDRYAPRMRELAQARRADNADRDALRQQMQTLALQMRDEAAQVLTEEQRAQLAARADVARQRGRDAQAIQQRKAARAAALNLTEEQRRQIEEQRALMRERHQQMREQRQRGEARGDRRQALRPRENGQSGRSVLNEQQREVMQIHHALQRALAPAGRR